MWHLGLFMEQFHNYITPLTPLHPPHPLLFFVYQQVVSDNSTETTSGGNSTNNLNTTTMATDSLSSPTNSTSPTGAGVSLHPGTFSFLIPFIVAASLLQCYCWSPDHRPTHLQEAPLVCLNTPSSPSPPVMPLSSASPLSTSWHRDRKTNKDTPHKILC